ncbi:MAG: hypothetical protein CW335_00005 [Clostridiales bacterium]|nr:hypothetical protein [Clostridiales bacterium]
MKRKICAMLLMISVLLSVLPLQAAAVTGTALTNPPIDGEKVVIYNIASKMAMKHTTAETGYNIPSGSVAGGTLCNGALIFTVHYDGTYYTFENKGRYLCTSDEEDLFFSPTQTSYTRWKLIRQDGGYTIENATAKYSGTGRNVCVEYYAPSFRGWTYAGNYAEYIAMGFYRVDDPHNVGFVVSPTAFIAAPDAYIGTDYSFTVQLEDFTGITSLNVTCSLGGGTAKRLTPSSQYGTAYSYTLPASELNGHSSLTLSAQVTNEYGVFYSAAKTVVIRDEPQIGQTLPIYSTSVDAQTRPEIAAELINCGTAPTLQMKLDGAAVSAKTDGSWATYTPAAALSTGAHTVSLRVTRKDGKTAEKSWEFYVGSRPVKAYFGQIHSHTDYSDGYGTLSEAYQHAMGAKDVDFLIVTDHSNYFDTSSTATVSSYYNLSPLKLTEDKSTTKWKEARLTAEQYNEKSTDFVAAYGYEMTWTAGPGHTNTFNTYGTVSKNNRLLNEKLGYAGMYLYDDLMVNANRGLDENGNPTEHTKHIDNAPIVSQLNHPGVTFGTFDEYAGYNEARDEVICLIEVGNGSGSVLNSGYWRSYTEYDKCLAMGWHVAPTNNQDNHSGRWGDSNTHRTVIVTNDFTEAGLYRAMSQRRVYATEDQNLTIYYYLNDALMGDIVQTNDDEIHITAQISDPDGERLQTVAVIGENGLILQSFTATGASCMVDTRLSNTQKYYYLKITEADGDIAVTAPVWVEPDVSGICRHVWDKGTVTKQATCTTNGECVYTCLRCGETKTEILYAQGHREVIDSAIPATCTASGKTEGSHCSVCGTVLRAQTVIPAQGHQVVTDPAVTQTCTVDGKTEGSHCARCGKVFVVQVITPATGHDYQKHEIMATCTEPGYTEYTCLRCGDTYRQNFTPLADHTWSDGTVTLVPTTHSTGVMTYVCTVCGKERTESIPATQPERPCDGGKDCPSRKFTDVKNDWAHAGIDFAIERGLFNGMSTTAFCPNSPMTRAMLVTVLWRYAGEPMEGENGFYDVSDDKWYADAVAWAAENGIVTGVGGGKFDPNGNVTREQLAAILFRYADSIGRDVSAGKKPSGFADRSKVSSWASDAMSWAVAEEIIGGAEKNGKLYLLPQDDATRAQVAKMLMQFIRNVAE